MAESDNKRSRSQDRFADDLDSMLDLDDLPAQTVGMVEDDDAIDQLLNNESFDMPEESKLSDPVDDLEQLIANQVDKDFKLAPEFDEFADDFDELMADVAINPKQNKDSEPEIVAIDDDLPDEVDLTALESVAEIEILDEEITIPDFKIDVDNDADVFKDMAEIDEFADDAEVSFGSTDLTPGNFDISPDDSLSEPAFEQATAPVLEQSAALLDDQLFADDMAANDTQATLADEPAEAMPAPANPPVVEQTPPPSQPQPSIDYAALLAGLNNQIAELSKKNAQLRNELTHKASKDDLNACLNQVDTLQADQKKAKRQVDLLNAKKPISAYVANGIAVVALVVGGSLGFQGFIAKSQLTQVVEYLDKLQTQINEAPNADAAEKQMLRSQLDELARSNSVNSEQLAALTKAINGESGSGGAGHDLAKQLASLSQQDMQMGAAIETLQQKVAALEKGRPAVAAPKPEPKKPPVVKENWAVNLVAFKQEWYAKRKAEEYAAKGVAAMVSKSEAKGEIWYRLLVDGFASQYEAAAYAARVKKTLNLDAVSVTQIKH